MANVTRAAWCQLVFSRRQDNARDAMLLTLATVEQQSDIPTFILGILLGAAVKWLADIWLQRTQFHHQLRLEKEYGSYSDLWEALFVLRRDLGALVDPDLIPIGQLPEIDDVTRKFNAYQSIVRRGEPFMHQSVVGPARAITERGRAVIDNLKIINDLDLKDETNMAVASRLEDENGT